MAHILQFEASSCAILNTNQNQGQGQTQGQQGQPISNYMAAAVVLSLLASSYTVKRRQMGRSYSSLIASP